MPAAAIDDEPVAAQSGPWSDYAKPAPQQADGPWSDYKPAPVPKSVANPIPQPVGYPSQAESEADQPPQAAAPVTPSAPIPSAPAPPPRAPSLTDNPANEGIYQMRGPGGTVGVPYSKVQSAKDQGFDFASEATRQRNIRDTLADPKVRASIAGGLSDTVEGRLGSDIADIPGAVARTGSQLARGLRDVYKPTPAEQRIAETYGDSPQESGVVAQKEREEMTPVERHEANTQAIRGMANTLASGGKIGMVIGAPELIGLSSEAYAGSSVARAALMKIAASVIAGAAGSAGAGKMAEKFNLSPEAQDLARQAAFWAGAGMTGALLDIQPTQGTYGETGYKASVPGASVEGSVRPAYRAPNPETGSYGEGSTVVPRDVNARVAVGGRSVGTTPKGGPWEDYAPAPAAPQALPKELPASTDRTVHQASTDPDALRESAAAQEKPTVAAVERAVEGVDGAEVDGSRVKDEQSQQNKADREKPVETQKDHLGVRVAAETPEAQTAAVGAIAEQMPVVGTEPLDNNGLKGTQVMVRTGEPGDPNQVSEIQVLPKAQVEAMKETDALYEQQKQALAAGDQAKADELGRQITAKHEAALAGTKPAETGTEPAKTETKGVPAETATTSVKSDEVDSRKYDYGSTQANLPEGSPAHGAIEAARDQIADADLMGKGKDIGDNHVTVRYGIQGDDTAGIRDYLSRQAPFEAMLGPISSFPPSKNSDGAAVLKADVDAPELHRMNREIAKEGQFADTGFLDYKPHVTIAYVNPDAVDKYAGSDATAGKTFRIDSIAISDRDGKLEHIPLKGGNSEQEKGVADNPQSQAKAGEVGKTEPAKPVTTGTAVRLPDGRTGVVKGISLRGDVEVKLDGGGRARAKRNEVQPVTQQAVKSAKVDTPVEGVTSGTPGHEKPSQGAIAEDFDQTIAQYQEGKYKAGELGKPRPAELDYVKKLLADGKDVWIFTARAATPEDVAAIKAWTKEHLGRELPVTNVKYKEFSVFRDDRMEAPKGEESAQPTHDEAKGDAAGQVERRPVEGSGAPAVQGGGGQAAEPTEAKRSVAGGSRGEGGRADVEPRPERPTEEDAAQVIQPEPAATRKAANLGSTFYSGLDPALFERLFPAPAQRIKDWLSDKQDEGDIQRAEMRQTRGEMDRRVARGVHLLATARREWSRRPREDSRAFINAIQNGVVDTLPPKDQALANLMAGARDQINSEIEQVSEGFIDNFIENYWPQSWEQSSKVAQTLKGMLTGKRPFAGKAAFTKRRKIPTFQDGLDWGFKPKTWNPVEQFLMDYAQRAQFLMGHQTLQAMKDAGTARYVAIGNKAPEGWTQVDDRIGTVYGNPNIPVTEYYDKAVWNALQETAQNLLTQTTRKMKIGGTRLGYYSTLDGIVTKTGTPLDVMAHELGHAIDQIYGLKDQLVKDKRFKQELRDLADLRFEGSQPSAYYKSYVRKGEEKIAAIFQAFVHTPERFKEVAPNTYAHIQDFLKQHEELKPLAELKKSLTHEGRTDTVHAGGMVIRGYYYAPAEAARVFNNFVSRGIAGRSGVYDTLNWMNRNLNALQLGISAFHAATTTINAATSDVALGIQQLAEGKPLQAGISMAKGSTIAPSAIRTLVNGSRLMREYLDPGRYAKFASEAQGLAQAGGRVRQNTIDIKPLDQVISAWRNGAVKEGLTKIPAAIIDATTRPIMEYYVPRMKAGAFYSMAHDILDNAQRHDWDDAKVRAKMQQAWDSIDNRFGQMVYDNLFWHKGLRDSLQLATRSVGWNFGDIRELGGGAADATRAAGQAASGRAPDITPRMAFAIALPLVSALIGGILTKLWTSQNPQNWKDYFYPRTADGTRHSIPGYMKDVVAVGNSPVQTTLNKLGPIWAMTADAINNRDFYGTEIRHKDDSPIKQLGEFSTWAAQQAIPFSISSGQKLIEQHGAETTLAEMLKHPGDLALGQLGFQSAPSYVQNSDALNAAREYGRDNRPPGTKTKDQAEHLKAFDAVVQMYRNKAVDRDQIQRYVKEGKLTPASASKAAMESLQPQILLASRSLSVEQILNVYDKATPEEKKELDPLVARKIRDIPDPDKRQEVEDAYKRVVGEEREMMAAR